MTKRTAIILLILVIGLGAVMRIWGLHTIPPGLYPDEALNANDAVATLATGDWRVFYPDNNGREGLFVWLITGAFWLFGISTWSLRLVSAVGGILVLPAVYLLTRSLLDDRRLALLATLFTAISFWHINFSRIGFRAIWMVTLLVWGTWLLWEGLHTRRDRWSIHSTPLWMLIGGGAVLGLSAYTYVGVRLFPLVLLALFIWHLWRNNWRREAWTTVAIPVVAALVITAPLLLFFVQHPDQIGARSGDVSIFTAERPLAALGTSALKTAGMFHVLGDCNWRHNYARPALPSGRACAPQLLWPVGVVFLIGLSLSLRSLIRNERRGAHGLLLAWFLVMLLPAILTREGIPHALRSIGVLPVPFLYAAIGTHWLYHKMGPPRRWWLAALIVVLAATGFAQWRKYAVLWGTAPETEAAFEQPLVDAGETLLTRPAETNRIVVVNKPGVIVDGVPMPAQTVKFLFNRAVSRDGSVREDASVRYIDPETTSEPLRDIVAGTPRPSAVLLLQPDPALSAQIASLPNVRVESYDDFTLIHAP